MAKRTAARKPWLRVLPYGLTAVSLAVAGYYAMSALRIADHPSVNLPLPRDLTTRLVYEESAAVRDDISDLTGRVVTIRRTDGNTKKRSERLVVAGPPTVVERVSDGVVYESKVDKRASSQAKGTYLAGLEATFGVADMLEVTITDVATARLRDDQVDWAKVHHFANELREVADTTTCLVQGARLATISYRAYAKSTSRSSLAQGDVFAFGGSIYSSTQRHTVDYVVSLDCLALSAVRDIANRTGLSQLPEALRPIRAVSALRALVVDGRITEGQVDGPTLGTLLRPDR
jgi:hypothetical protein